MHTDCARGPPTAPPPQTTDSAVRFRSKEINEMVTPGFLVALSAALTHLDAGRTEMAQAIGGFLLKLLSI